MVYFCLLSGTLIGLSTGYVLFSKPSAHDMKELEDDQRSTETTISKEAREQNYENQRRAETESTEVVEPSQVELRIEESSQLYPAIDVLSEAKSANPTELAAILQQVMANKSVHERLPVDGFLLARWTELDPHGALNYVIGLENGVYSNDLWIVMETWAGSDPSGIVEAIENLSLSEKDKDRAYMVALSTYAEHDPHQAITFLNDMDIPSVEPWFLNSLHYKLAEKDLKLATAHALNLEEPRAQNNAMEAITKVITVDYPPLEALQKAETLPERYNHWATSRIFDQWYSRSAEEAVNTLLDMPQGNQRLSALSPVLNHMTQENPANAAEWVKNNLSENEQNIANEHIYQLWEQLDPDAANAYFEVEPIKEQ